MSVGAVDFQTLQPEPEWAMRVKIDPDVSAILSPALLNPKK